MEKKDKIYHTTRTKPRFKDRLRVLFGATIVVDSTIKVDKDVDVVHSFAKDSYTFKNN